MVGFKKKP